MILSERKIGGTLNEAMRIEGQMSKSVVLILAGLCSCVQISAQVATPSSAQPRKARTAAVRAGPVIVENRPSAPQVVTILHRLTGFKMFRLLLRSGDVSAIARLDDAFQFNGEVHTNVIAGLALDDCQTIAAWLPEAEAETASPPPPPPFAPNAPTALMALPSLPRPLSPAALPAPDQSMNTVLGNVFESPDVTVIARNGKRLTAQYIGLDGATGLSVLKLSEKSLPETINAKEEVITVGQHLRLFGPAPAAEIEPSTGGTVYVRMGETEGRVISVTRAPDGGIARLKIRSTRLSSANIGGIAINDAGETVGIINAVEGSEATILPSALIRSAAKRVLERQSSVPRPWLGVRGEPVGAQPLEQILRGGWQAERAMSLFEEHRGILLTSVAPGSPAAVAALRPGDVILRVNDGDVRNADDFSWFLEEAGSGSSVRFTVARPGRLAPEAVMVKLSESPDPLFGLRMPEGRAAQMVEPGSLIAHGIETVALKPGVASRFGANGGLLVVYVRPSAAAFNAGLRPGDVIEAIDGQQISSEPIKLSTIPGASYSFSVVRNKEKLVLTIVTSLK